MLPGAQLGCTTDQAALLTVEFHPQRAARLGLCRNVRLSSRRLLRSEEQPEAIRLGTDAQVAAEALSDVPLCDVQKMSVSRAPSGFQAQNHVSSLPSGLAALKRAVELGVIVTSSLS